MSQNKSIVHFVVGDFSVSGNAVRELDTTLVQIDGSDAFTSHSASSLMFAVSEFE